jgi:hypothetical protein
MRRAGFGLLLVLAICLVGGGLAEASSHDGIDQTIVRRVAVTFGSDDTVDIAPAGDSPGDTFLGQAGVWNFDLTRRFGGYASACVLETVSPRLNHCTATIRFPEGTIELGSRFNFTDIRPGFRLAVIGGTGTFQNVVGQATYSFGCDECPPGSEDVDTLTLHLIPSFRQPSRGAATLDLPIGGTPGHVPGPLPERTAVDPRSLLLRRLAAVRHRRPTQPSEASPRVEE